METPLEPIGPGDPIETLRWWQVWIRALTRPNERTYQALVDDPRAGLGRAAAWVALSSTLYTLLISAAQIAFGGLRQALVELSGTMPLEAAPPPEFLLLGVICLIPFSAALAVTGLLLNAGILQFIAGALGGQGSVARLAYALAAFTAPATLVMGGLSVIPLVGMCLSLPFSLYIFCLQFLAVKAVNRFSWGHAVATVALQILLVTLIALVVGFLAYDFVLEALRASGMTI
jgi:hypothetical protein